MLDMGSVQSPNTSPRSKRGLLLLVGVAALVLLFLVLSGRRWRVGNGDDPRLEGPPKADVRPEDPRLTFVTPYRNVRPDVKYVGDAACVGCHARQAKTYREHPMGRSLAPLAEAVPLERYTVAASKGSQRGSNSADLSGGDQTITVLFGSSGSGGKPR